ncbi:MAG: methyltransferase domain-containing protein [Verrucomicrobiota bacterium]
MKRPSVMQVETERLTRSWERHDASFLRDYLVADVEDPRLNVQSILTRHFLLRCLFGERWEEVMREELRFAVVMNWWRGLLQQPLVADDFAALLHAVRRHADNAEGLEIPAYVLNIHAARPATLAGLPFPDYLSEAIQAARRSSPPRTLPEPLLNTFQTLWKQVLARKRAERLRVLEPACGSANDYRFFAAFGLARLLEYHGMDLSAKNVANARKLFPKVDFQAGNVLQIKAAKHAFSACVVHDLFEHLSIEAMTQAVREVCRVTRHGLCVNFFNLHEAEEHTVHPVEEYHWNTLSLPAMRTLFESHGFTGQIIHVGTLLAQTMECPRTHNPNAYTFYLWRE